MYRRQFVTRVAVGGGAIAAGGFWWFEGSSAAQAPRAASPLTRELQRQLRQAVGKMKAGQGEGARQFAATLRVWASSVDDGAWRAQLRAAVNKAGRQALILHERPHREMEEAARELGFTLPAHVAPDLAGREAALDALLKGGLGAFIEQAAVYLDDAGDKLDRAGGAVRLIAAQAPGSSTCLQVCAWADMFATAMDVTCAAFFIFPNPATEMACLMAISAWIGALGACAICNICGCG